MEKLILKSRIVSVQSEIRCSLHLFCKYILILFVVLLETHFLPRLN